MRATMKRLKTYRETFWSALAGSCLVVLGLWSLSFGGKPTTESYGISPEKVAEYGHAVVRADRTIYTTHVVERMQEKGITNF